MKTNRILGAIVVILMLAPFTVLAEDDCSANVSASLDRQEGSSLQFEVEVSTSASCAHIEYDLIIKVQLSNGQLKHVRKPRVVKVNDGSLTEIVEHRLADGESMLSYEAKVVKCSKCDLSM